MIELKIRMTPETMRELTILADLVAKEPAAMAAHIIAKGTREAIATVRQRLRQPVEQSKPRPLAAEPPPETDKRTGRGGYRRRSPAIRDRDRTAILEIVVKARGPVTPPQIARRIGRTSKQAYDDCNALCKDGLLERAGSRDRFMTFRPARAFDETGEVKQ